MAEVSSLLIYKLCYMFGDYMKMLNQKISLQINKIFKILILLSLAGISISCGGGGSSGTVNPPGPEPTPTPTLAEAVNIGNISTIPITANNDPTSLIVTNNTDFNLHLVTATVTMDAKVTNLDLHGGNVTTAGSDNVSQCATLQAKGTCGVVIIPPADTGSYLLTLSFVSADGSKTFTANQIITFSKNIPSTTGFTYSNLNNAVYAPVDGYTYMQIPFTIDHDTKTLYAYSSNPGAFVPNLVCPGGTTYQKGDLCTVYVRIGNLGTAKDLIATVTVSDDPDPHPIITSGFKRNMENRVNGSTGYSFSTPVSVTTNNVGNLVTSASNPVINPANGASPVTITLLNNGVAPITGITLSVAAGSPVTITNSGVGSCGAAGGTLAVESSCTYQVNANSPTSSQSMAYINYNNSLNNAQLIYAVVYISALPGPGMSLTAAQGSLQNAVIGTTSKLTLNVQNTGTTTLNNIKFSALPVIASGTLTYESAASTCKLDGTQQLNSGAKCTVSVNFLPSIEQSAASFNISAIANYIDQGGTSQTYSGLYLTVQYSSFTSNAFVYLIPNYTSYAIRADNADSATQVITLVNSGGQNVTLDSPSYTAESFPTGASVINDGCAGFTLTSGGGTSCNITVKYGPVAAVQTSKTGRLKVAYTPGSGLAKVTAFATEVFQAQAAALVRVESVVKSGGSAGGAGTAASPYTFYNSAYTGSPIIFTFTYKNVGTQSASSFAVNVNNLPVGYIVYGTPTCGYGSTTSTLPESGGVCNIAFTAIGPSTFWNPFYYAGALNLNIPGYSYKDPNTGVNVNPAPTFPAYNGNTIYVNANLFSNLSSPTESSATAESGGSFNVRFVSTAGDSAQYGGAGVTITIPPTSLPTESSNSIYLANGRTCQITSVTGNCVINITNKPNAVAGLYTYAYWITPQGLTPAPSNSIIKYFTFTLY
ncbi:MAG: hypothetical protein K0R94_143 [Burkholderiales bacterium]|jgi:hypothetical protein|nr:hypothetical protein [Burkholderiales bacterium]